jgi:hypothetical protein
MSDDINKLVEQLEKATAPGEQIDASLDAETRSLREGWLALGQLIEAAQPPSAHPPLILAPQQQYPAQPVPTRRRKLAASKTLVASAALAASLLVAALATWSFVTRSFVNGSFVNGSFVNGRQDPQIVQDQQNQTPAPVVKVTTPVLVQDNRNPSDSAGDELDWDAPLDSEIAAAGQEMLRIQSDWHASDDTSSAIYYRMQQMRQELNDNTL